MRRQFKGVTRTLHFFTVVGAVQHLVSPERPGHAHVRLVPQHIIGPRQLGFHRGHHQLGGSGAQTNHGQTPACTPDVLRVQRRIRHAHAHTIGEFTPDGCHNGLIRADKTQRHRQFAGRLAQPGTGHHPVIGHHAGQRLPGQFRLMQRVAQNLRRHFLRDFKQDAARVDQQFVGRRLTLGIAHVNRQARLLVFGQLRLRQPGRLAFNAHRLTSQQIRNKAFALLKIAQSIATGRVQQAGAKPQLTAGGDGRRHPQTRRKSTRQIIHATQPAQQRHHRAGVFGNRQHRRFGTFLQQQGREGADHDACRAERNNRRVLLI